MESNISFISNVNICSSSLDSRKGDEKFLRKVKDYYALEKLRSFMGGYTNSNYYLFSYEQLKIVSPEFYGNFVRPKVDEDIRRNNELMDARYGYSGYDERQLAPLIGDTELEYDNTMWDGRVSYYDFSGKAAGVSDDRPHIGKWDVAGTQHSMVDSYGGGINPTTYYFNRIKKQNVGLNDEIDVHSDQFEEVSDIDPYYYIYREEAGAGESDIVTDPAEAYLAKYNIYNAFISSEQEDIIRADPSERIFVNAGPGTGKTYTLIEKINYMVQWQGVEPETIQVLCFTNAAVEEVKDRLAKFVDDGGTRSLINVDVRTFHSFAWWLINQANALFVGEDGFKWIDMQSLTYDSSINTARYIMSKFDDQILAGWSHFIVDEIQDLTDVRARFVLQMVKSCMKNDVGITVFGDSCQAIYDYSQDAVMFPMSSTEFYVDLFKKFLDTGRFLKLNINHRQTDTLIAVTQGLREAILKADMSLMKKEVRTLQDEIIHLPGDYISRSITDVEILRLKDNGKICFLCRNNGQVLRLSSNLRKRGVGHVINAYENNMNFAGWIGAVFYDYEKETISFDELTDKIEDFNLPINPEVIWEKLQAVIGTDNMRLVVEDIHNSIVQSKVDDPILRQIEKGDVIVSNIHRAKGREYQTVVIENAFASSLVRRTKDIGEFKTLYVGITRPKEHLYFASLIKNEMRLYTIFATGRKRWLKQIGRQLKFIEVRNMPDIDVNSFVDLGNKNQSYIIRNVHVGDEIRVVRSKPTETFGYRIVHVTDEEEHLIGKLTSEFIEDLEAIIQPESYADWPSTIEELYVTGVFTHYDTQNRNRVWCWVDFCGLGHVYYDTY